MNSISFTAPVRVLASRWIIQLPDEVSRSLPSRGQVAVQATVNGHTFSTVVEPDGEFGHWLNLDSGILSREEVAAGSSADIMLTPAAEWPEPVVPRDLAEAIAASPLTIQLLWNSITPMARREWVRWINATRNAATRERRIEVAISKMEHGKRRPCCFNLASCTDPELSRSGKLIKLSEGST